MEMMVCRSKKCTAAVWESLLLSRLLQVCAVIFLVSGILLSAGCNSTFGVKQEVWKNLSEKQKNKVIDEFDVSMSELDRDQARTFPVEENARSGMHFSSFSTSNYSHLDGYDLHLNLRLITDPPENFRYEERFEGMERDWN